MFNTLYYRTTTSIAVLTLVSIITLALYFPSLQWLGRQLTLHPINAILFFLLPLVWWFRSRTALQLQALQFSIPPTLLLCSFIVIYLWNEYYLGIHIFSAVCMLGTFYSLLGLILPLQQWKNLVLPVSILTLLLPFSSYLDVYLGFPLRLFCAEQASIVLRILGFSSLHQESLLLFEKQAVNVDLACSGIKGLWTGSIFYLVLSMIEGYRINSRWLLIALLFLILLVISNVMRIVTLVLLDIFAGLPQLADVLHQALGLIGFSVSCLIAWALLRLTQASRQIHRPKQSFHVYSATKNIPYKASALLITGLVCALLLHKPYQATPLSNSTTPLVDFTLNNILPSSPLLLNDVEKQFFVNNQAQAQKFTFQSDALSGSLLLVSSIYWKAQHEPHNCYMAQGFSLGFEGTWLLNNHDKGNSSAVRFIKINQAQQTAVYWFQSADTITANYSARVFDGLFTTSRPWVLVSILFNQPVSQQSVEPLLRRLQQYLAVQLSKGMQRE